ncbi:MAG: helix-turn-helix domain-containing protein [Pseudonocardiaceae bacterium]
MALRRQGLSQRRKAVGFTQESLAEHLGVERSTVVRWEAGDTEPLPSIRPKVARALHVSIDQLTELLTGPETAGTTRALSADNEVTIPMLLPEVRSEVLPGRTESGRPVAADADLKTAIAFCAVLSTLSRLPVSTAHPANTDTAGMNLRPDTPATTTGGAGGRGGSASPKSAQTGAPPRSSLTAVPLDVEPADIQRRRVRSRRCKRFAAAGVVALAFAAGAASVPFITSYSGSILPAAAGNPTAAAPVAANPDHRSRSKDSTGAVDTAPVAAPNNSADGPAPPATAAIPAPPTIRSDNRTTSRSKSRTSTTPSSPRIPAIPAEAAAWSRMARLSASDQRMTQQRMAQLWRQALQRP